MSEPEPLPSQAYSEEWLASAWGEGRNAELLEPGPIRPRPRMQRAVDLSRLATDLRVLDIACGRGEMPAIVAQAGGIGIGLDYAQAPLRLAAEVRAVHGGGRSAGAMELLRGDATRLPFADASFERVTMLDIVEHLHPAQLAAMFREVRRVLAPGGYAVVHTLPNRWVYDVTYPLIHRLTGRVPADPRGPFDREIHVNEQDLPGLHRVLAGVGLRHRIWLEQHIPAQARWNAGRDRYADNRDQVYPLLAGSLGRVVEGLSIGPLKLLLCNDIFGLLWRPEDPAPGPLPLALTERLTCAIA